MACHAAWRAVQLCESERALLASVNLMLTRAVGLSFAVAGMTSAKGWSKYKMSDFFF